ncbi:MAG TPA: ECF transporter S component [Anaerolineae bacterium]|jgi:energy-coupling factor transport system substrate-specific component
MSAQDLTRVQSPINMVVHEHQAQMPGTDQRQHQLGRFLSVAIYVLASLIGLTAFLYPFFTLSAQASAAATQQMAHGADSPLVLALLIGLCLAALAVEAQGQVMSAKVIALLGILVAINSALRFAEAVVRGPGGFSPVFMLIILCGFVFGSRFGFMMGILSLLVSAIITGGSGPWLPYQMFTAGWMGMSSGWLGQLVEVIQSKGKVRKPPENSGRFSTFTIIMLCTFGALWGFIYGAIMNLWFWPYQAGDPAQSWQTGMGIIQGLQRYLAFYLATSFVWDVFAAIGNIVLIGLFGPPTLRALRRFKNRFMFTFVPTEQPVSTQLAGHNT